MTIYFDKRAFEEQEKEAAAQSEVIKKEEEKQEAMRAAAGSCYCICQTCNSHAIMELVDANYLWSCRYWLLQSTWFVSTRSYFI